jgi:hypothetical protein
MLSAADPGEVVGVPKVDRPVTSVGAGAGDVMRRTVRLTVGGVAGDLDRAVADHMLGEPVALQKADRRGDLFPAGPHNRRVTAGLEPDLHHAVIGEQRCDLLRLAQVGAVGVPLDQQSDRDLVVHAVSVADNS